MSKRLGEIKGYKYKTSSWHLMLLSTVLGSIQYLLFLTLQVKETNFRGHRKIKKTQTKSKHLRKILYRFLKITSSEKQEAGDVCMYGHSSMDQPGKVANPARVQLNRET